MKLNPCAGGAHLVHLAGAPDHDPLLHEVPVGHDGVHLNDAGKQAVRSIIQRRLRAFYIEREKVEQGKSMDCGANPEGSVEKKEEVLVASQFAGFAGMMVANGLSYSKPKSSLAGDL